MLRAALTGGIATGKSFCLSRFAAFGAAVIDADDLSREAVARGSGGLKEVVRRFGRGVLLPDGSLNRKALGRTVFTDASARAELEAIVHPLVYRQIDQWFADLPAGTRVALADIPLLFETGHEHDFERVVVCACDPGEQLRRVMSRDRLDAGEARARIAAQWPISEKMKRADYVIMTDWTFAETEVQVRKVFEIMRSQK
jgi:dephospho-CoA kinase